MAFSATGRTDVAGIIPENYSSEFLAATVANSAVLSTFRTIRLGTKVTRMPVLSALPTAGFVSEYPTAGHEKPTTSAQWTNETITVEEIATIVPIPESVLEDSTVDLFDYMRPLIGEAFGKVIDGAVLFGTSKPSTWTSGLLDLAKGSSQRVQAGGAGNDIADDLNDTFAEVEGAGFDVNTVFMGRAMRARLRGLRDSNGQFIYSSLSGGTDGSEGVYGAQVAWVGNGSWSEAANTGAYAIACDRSRLVVGIRSDMDYKVLTEATVDGVNLAESDMVALRVKMRLGWAVNRGVNALGGTLPVGAYTAADV